MGARLPVNASIVRRSWMSLCEECALEQRAPGTYCPGGSMPKTLELMGFSEMTVWNGGDLPQNLENVATTVMPKCKASGRFHHASTAFNGCAPEAYEALWEAMFSDMGAQSGALRGKRVASGSSGGTSGVYP